MMTILRNRGRWGGSNVVYRKGMIERYDKERSTPEMKWIDYGLGGLQKSALTLVDMTVTDLSVLQKELAERNLLCGIRVQERFYEIGTPEALEETQAFLASTEEKRGS